MLESASGPAEAKPPADAMPTIAERAGGLERREGFVPFYWDARQGQLLLEVMKKEVGWTFASWEFDFSEENRKAFKKACQVYRTRYQHLFKVSPETRKERAGFLHFCGTHGLTLEGRIFILWFRFKGWIGRAIRFVAK